MYYWISYSFSFIGMASQEVSIKQNVSIILKSDTEMLDDVVVVAYGMKSVCLFLPICQFVSALYLHLSYF